MITGNNIDLEAMRVGANHLNKRGFSQVKVSDDIYVYWTKGNGASISQNGKALVSFNMNNFDNHGKLRKRLNKILTQR